MLFAIFSFLFFFFLTFIFFAMIKASRIINSKKLELQFLFMTASTLEYKYYLIQLVELIYQEKIEKDQEKQKELDLVKEKIEEKFNKFINDAIINIKKSLDYQVEYEDLKGAIKYIEKTLRVKINGHRFDS